MTALDNARTALAQIDDRLAVSRIGRSLTREMDRDMITLKDSGAALDALIGAYENLAERDTSRAEWAARDTVTGATYPQPNRLIAEKVAEMHGLCEVVRLAGSEVAR